MFLEEGTSEENGPTKARCTCKKEKTTEDQKVKSNVY